MTDQPRLRRLTFLVPSQAFVHLQAGDRLTVAGYEGIVESVAIAPGDRTEVSWATTEFPPGYLEKLLRSGTEGLSVGYRRDLSNVSNKGDDHGRR